MSSLPKLCPNCGVGNPSQVIICRNCGFSFEKRQNGEKIGGQSAAVTTRTALPLGLEIISDWLGVFFSLGFGLKRFVGDRRGWIKFIIDICALAIISGFALLISVSVNVNDSGEFANEIRDVQLELGAEGDTELFLSGVIYAFGSAIGTVFYLIVVHYVSMFFEGKGDLFDHFHMNLSVDVMFNLLGPIAFIVGTFNIFAFLVVAAILVIYRVYLQLRVIQVVQQIPFVFALLAAIVAPIIFSCLWFPIAGGL